MIRIIIPSLILFAFPCFGKTDNNFELPDSITQFLDLNCYECHNNVDKKGELDLESLRFDPSDHSNMDRWAFVHDRIKEAEMPPPKDSLVEPSERAGFLDEFEDILHEISCNQIKAEGRVKSRRLSRIEYENTLHNLLGT